MENGCNQCPRACGVDRKKTLGFCGVPDRFLVARAAKHMWEEPIISGKNGSGTIFFCGCNLRCVFCQNRAISHGAGGEEVSGEELERIMLRLQEEGVHNVNLVTPTPYAKDLRKVLLRVKPRLKIPVVYNCGGYESVETLRSLEGLVDVWLPDVKYYDGALSKRYSSAKDYYEVAVAALEEMLRQCPTLEYGEDGMLLRGVMVRHLVLPGCRRDSIVLLEHLAERFGANRFLLSLMSQYTPQFAMSAPDRSLHRTVTTFEYESVAGVAISCGFEGFFQSKDSATAEYTPDFLKK